jgi:hypothetical protein
MQKCKGKGILTFLKPQSSLKSVDNIETDLEDLLSKFTNVVSQCSLAEKIAIQNEKTSCTDARLP